MLILAELSAETMEVFLFLAVIAGIIAGLRRDDR